MAALSTALIVGAGIAGGTSLAAAGIGAHAAGKASEQQQESADQALALQREMYQQQRADTAPWRNAGGQAVTTLSGLMGLPSGPVGGAAAGPGVPSAPGYVQAQQRYARQADAGSVNTPGGVKAFPASSSYPESPPVVPGSPSASGYVTMESPDGERRDIPAEQKAFYESWGAKTV